MNFLPIDYGCALFDLHNITIPLDFPMIVYKDGYSTTSAYGQYRLSLLLAGVGTVRLDICTGALVATELASVVIKIVFANCTKDEIDSYVELFHDYRPMRSYISETAPLLISSNKFCAPILDAGVDFIDYYEQYYDILTNIYSTCIFDASRIELVISYCLGFLFIGKIGNYRPAMYDLVVCDRMLPNCRFEINYFNSDDLYALLNKEEDPTNHDSYWPNLDKLSLVACWYHAHNCIHACGENSLEKFVYYHSPSANFPMQLSEVFKMRANYHEASEYMSALRNVESKCASVLQSEIKRTSFTTDDLIKTHSKFLADARRRIIELERMFTR